GPPAGGQPVSTPQPAAAPPAHPRCPQAATAARKPGTPPAAGLGGPALDGCGNPGPARVPGREPAVRSPPAPGQLSPGVSARLGQQDLLHATAAGAAATGERRHVLAGPPGGRSQSG